MKLLRMSEGYTKDRTVRYFAVPRTFERLFKILDSYRYKEIEFFIANFGDESSLRLFECVPNKYKNALRADLTRKELAKLPLKTLLEHGFTLMTRSAVYHHDASLFLSFEVVDFDETYEKVSQDYASKLCDVPFTNTAYNVVIHAYKVGDRDLKIDTLYNMDLVYYKSGEEKPDHFYSNDGNEVVRNALPTVEYFIHNYGMHQNAEFSYKLIDATPYDGHPNWNRYIESRLIKCLKTGEPIEIRSVESSFNLNNPKGFKPHSPCVLYIDTEKSYRLKLQREYEREIKLLQGYRRSL